MPGCSSVGKVNGRDRPGLLYEVTRALYALNLSIGSAHVATYGERAVDVFYVKDLTGMKVTQKGRLATIERRLLDVLRTPEERAAAAEAASAKAEPEVQAYSDTEAVVCSLENPEACEACQ